MQDINFTPVSKLECNCNGKKGSLPTSGENEEREKLVFFAWDTFTLSKYINHIKLRLQGMQLRKGNLNQRFSCGFQVKSPNKVISRENEKEKRGIFSREVRFASFRQSIPHIHAPGRHCGILVISSFLEKESSTVPPECATKQGNTFSKTSIGFNTRILIRRWLCLHLELWVEATLPLAAFEPSSFCG